MKAPRKTADLFTPKELQIILEIPGMFGCRGYSDFKLSWLSKVRSGLEISPGCQTTNKSQVAPLSAMGTNTTFGTFR